MSLKIYVIIDFIVKLYKLQELAFNIRGFFWIFNRLSQGFSSNSPESIIPDVGCLLDQFQVHNELES